MTTMTDEGAVFTAYRTGPGRWGVMELDRSGEFLGMAADGLSRGEAEAMALRLARGAEWVGRGSMLLLVGEGRGAVLYPNGRPGEWRLCRTAGKKDGGSLTVSGLQQAMAKGEAWVCGG